MSLDPIALGGANYLGIVAGGLSYFAFGALWYSVLFGKRWIASTGRSREEFGDASPGPEMLLTLLGALVSTGVIAVVYGWAGGSGLPDGIAVGALIGIGVAAMEGMKPVVYNFDERVRPWALYAINSGYAVSGFMLSGAVYALVT